MGFDWICAVIFIWTTCWIDCLFTMLLRERIQSWMGTHLLGDDCGNISIADSIQRNGGCNLYESIGCWYCFFVFLIDSRGAYSARHMVSICSICRVCNGVCNQESTR